MPVVHISIRLGEAGAAEVEVALPGDWEQEGLEPRASGQRAGGRRMRSRTAELVRASSRVGPLEENAEACCPICLEDFVPGSSVLTLPCLHTFHEACSDHYFRSRGVEPRCPVCRRHVGRRRGQQAEAGGTGGETLAAEGLQ